MVPMTSRAPYSIGYFDDGSGHGGTTRYLMELLQGLDRAVYHPVYYGFRPAWWHPQLVARNVEIVLLDPDAPVVPSSPPPSASTSVATPGKTRRLPKSVAWWLGLGRDVRELIHLFKKRPVDLFHSNNAGAEAAPMAARWAGIPRILATWHVESDYDFGKPASFGTRWLECRCMKSLDRAIAPAEHTKQDWIRRCNLGPDYERRVTVMHYGVSEDRLVRRCAIPEARAALQIPQDAVVIGSLGRLEPAKGYEYLIQAMPEILRHEPRALFVIGGRGYLENDLRERAAQAGVSNALRFIGFLPEIRDLLECLDVYIQPSLCEVTPMSLLEAGGMSVPLAGSDVGGVSEIIEHESNGLLFPPRDPARLAASMVAMLSSAERRAAMGRAARKKVEESFNLAAMIARTQALYQQMLKD
jgi:glycosyltransferase involved in cell wall biosynthesis